MHVKNGSKDLKRYPQISRRARATQTAGAHHVRIKGGSVVIKAAVEGGGPCEAAIGRSCVTPCECG